jgi:hypothetical protein
MAITLEVVALVASLVSVILAGFAIWLSWKFFDKSSSDSRNIEVATEKIGASVEKLQKVLDLFSNKHIDIIDKTQSALIKHAWAKVTPPDKIEEKMEEKAKGKITELKQSVDAELKRFIEKQAKTEGKLDSAQEGLGKIVYRAIDESRKVEDEARNETKHDVLAGIAKLFKAQGKSQVCVNDFLYRLPNSHIGVIAPEDFVILKEAGIVAAVENNAQSTTDRIDLF